MTLGDSISRIPFEKKRIEEEELRYNKLPAVNSVLFYEDEKGPVAAKIHIWWYIMLSSFVQSKKVSSKTQKIKGILNVFGIYMNIPITR